MARFDVYRQSDGPGFMLDCQADVLSMLTTRFMVPLLRRGDGPLPIARLNPALTVADEEVIMYTQFAASVPARELRVQVASLASDDHVIISALDMLLSGY